MRKRKKKNVFGYGGVISVIPYLVKEYSENDSWDDYCMEMLQEEKN